MSKEAKEVRSALKERLNRELSFKVTHQKILSRTAVRLLATVRQHE